MHHHHWHCPPADHCHAPCSPQPPPPFGQQELWWDDPAFHPSPLPARSCSSSSSDGTDVSCTVHVEAPSTAAPLLEPKPGDGAVPAPSLPVILYGVLFWTIFAWIVYSYWF